MIINYIIKYYIKGTCNEIVNNELKCQCKKGFIGEFCGFHICLEDSCNYQGINIYIFRNLQQLYWHN